MSAGVGEKSLGGDISSELEEFKKYKPELFFAIIARMGVNVPEVITAITGEAAKYNYDVFHIKVTKTLNWLKLDTSINQSPIEDRYFSHIQACNEARETSNDPSLFAKFIVAQIKAERKQTNKRGVIYIIDQLKRPEEIEHLRKTYGEALVAISCHAPLEKRVDLLKNKIIAGHGSMLDDDKSKDIARDLISLDESEEGSFGQNVRSAFPKEDYILNCIAQEEVNKGMSKLLRLIFGDPTVSPSYSEYGNNLAAQAAYRSIDLSLQVGAAIFDRNRKVISIGANEVPKYGGGTYWNDSIPDKRDRHLGYEANTIKKREILLDAVRLLQDADLLAAEIQDKTQEELMSHLLSDPDAALKDAKILDILEYGRGLHAEMNAITDAARINQSTQDADVFVTTFPCHNCAKHIVGAGVKNVYFLEPYAKSQVDGLYPDSISIDPEVPAKDKVNFLQFCGVTKRRFHYFSKEKSKDSSGAIHIWSEIDALCLIDRQPADYLRFEELTLKDLKQNKSIPLNS